MLVSKLRGALTSGFTWTEAFSTWMVPEYLPSNLVMISTLLVSTLLAFRPPMGVIIKEPLSLMWRTMAPSVSAWAVRVMGFPSPPMWQDTPPRRGPVVSGYPRRASSSRR